MTKPLILHKVTLGEFGKYAVVLPARSFDDATTIACLLYGYFDRAPFHQTQGLPTPKVDKPPPARPHNPERLIGFLGKLYNNLTVTAGPDRARFQSEMSILESQIDYFRREGHGRLDVNLRLHDALVAARHQPRQVIAAGWVGRSAANPPENSTKLRISHTQKFSQFAAKPAATAPQRDQLRAQWNRLKIEHGHVQSHAAANCPKSQPVTQRTYFDRLAERARSNPPPLPAHEQNNGPQRD